MLVESVWCSCDMFAVVWGRISKHGEGREDFLVSNSFETGPDFLFGWMLVSAGVRKTEFDRLVAREELEGGDPAYTVEEGVRGDFFTDLEAYKTLIEGQDVCAVDLDVLSDKVKKVGVVKETACAVLPENPRLTVSVSLK